MTMRHWLAVSGFLMTACSVTTSPAGETMSTPAPRSDGRVWNIDFEGFMDGGAGFLNAGVRQLGDGAPDVRQAEAFIVNARSKAFSGDKCAQIVTKKPGPGAQIGLQRRFDASEAADEVIEFVYRPTADKPVNLAEFVLWAAVGSFLLSSSAKPRRRSSASGTVATSESRRISRRRN
jgi:hypothetical protein